MKNVTQYPRVLIVYPSCINKVDQHGVSIREWFSDWPEKNLAQIYSGNEIGEKKFCGYNFKLGENERKFGSLFFKLKGSSLGKSSYNVLLNDNIKKIKKISKWSLYKNKVSGWLINTGLWEVIFRPKLSNELIKFITDFKPQIIYCQGYSLTFTWMPVILYEKFNIPICFQTGDDWPSYLYKSSPLSFAIRPLVHKAIKSLLSKSSVRFANGSLMAREYKKRYGMPFETLMMCDNLNRFRDSVSQRVVDNETISIVYSGNLGDGRWLSIMELSEAAKQISLDGFKIMITAFATNIHPEAVNKLQNANNLQILPAPSHEELPAYLKGADILFMPETFESDRANEIHLSISTKAHFYMMSEKPVLIYASPITGIVNYAKEDNWACIVDEKNINKLSLSLLELITNVTYRQKLVDRGLEVVLANHSENIVKTRLLSILQEL